MFLYGSLQVYYDLDLLSTRPSRPWEIKFPPGRFEIREYREPTQVVSGLIGAPITIGG